MYLLYLDESGNEYDPKDRHFVLGGMALFERSTFYVAQAVEEIQQRHFPGLQPVPFHAAHARSGSGVWRNIQQDKREAILDELGETISKANHPGLVLFAAAVEKTESVYREDAVKAATEDICVRFDKFLKRLHQAGDPQRGLVIFSEGRYHQRARIWVNGFRTIGTQYGGLYNIADIPYFANMRETRFLQLADHIAHAVYLMYERRDCSLIRPILSRFDQCDGILHGLGHKKRRDHPGCECPACYSRRVRGFHGPWVEELGPIASERHGSN
ncbi:MAG: DUF3800 domain-containing protein [Longimicrobiales bacterium]